MFLTLTDAEKETLRAQGFYFYDWGPPGTEAVRLVTSWNGSEDEAHRFAAALHAL